MQDPLTTEVQSPFLAGIVEGLNRISTGLDMKSETLTKVSMSPVQGLESSDPRRIYQVADGNRLWLSSPAPQIYLNNSIITPLSNDFTIDYVGGSITFYGSYRPSASDKITVSCDHIYSAPQATGGYQIGIKFSSDFLGMEYSVSSTSEYYTGVVKENLEEIVSVKSPNTEYTVSCKTQDGELFTSSISTDKYYGVYRLSMSSFSATIKVTSIPKSTITVEFIGESYDDAVNSFSKQADDSGNATFSIRYQGNYVVKSYYNDCGSSSVTLDVQNKGQEYTASVSFATLKLKSDVGSTIYLKNGDITISKTSTEEYTVFYIPNFGTWNVYASKDEMDTEYNIEISEYKEYLLEVEYIKDVFGQNSWKTISYVSSNGDASNYWECGDTKTIILNGTANTLTLNNFSIDAFIIGINHNSSREGNNLIHIQLGKVNGALVSLCDNYNDSSTHDGTGFCMNSSETNSGGWSSSAMRNTILGNSAAPDNPAQLSIMSILPEDLRSVMKQCTKYTNNTGGNSDSSSYITTTTDYLSLIAEYEILGSRTQASSYEKNYQSRYEYYSSGNSRIFHRHDITSSSIYSWERSPVANYSGYFCAVGKSGTASASYADASMGCSPIFYV